MSALLEAYQAQFKLTFAVQMQYRASLVIWLVGMMLEPTIYLVVWSTVARAQGGAVVGFGPRDFAAYFITTMLVNHWTFTWLMHDFEYSVRMGQLSPQLLRPLHPMHIHVADNVVYKGFTSLVMVPAAFMLAMVFDARFESLPWSLALAVPALAISFAARLMLGAALAFAAFWTTRVLAINEMYFLSSWFLSGLMAPLSLLPPVVQAVAAALPFRWFVAFPVELILGRLSLDEARFGFAMQAVWLVLIYGLFTFLWREGVKRYSAVGA
ncbi:MAG: ABC transporter permease [Chloroflexota bacterium]